MPVQRMGKPIVASFRYPVRCTCKPVKELIKILLISGQSGLEHQKRNRRFLLGVWTVNSPQSHIVRVYDAGHGKSGVFHSAEWHDGDWSSDGIWEAWLWFFIWVESF
ncbi:hypothetical protein TNCV_1329581 [Trichonephila clavipes]|nr:hypothetical protein TNCV_1329581 [Trichonephila clavipes]